MNRLVRKEVRSILPIWLLAMALAILPVWILWPGPQGIMLTDLGLLVFAPFGLGVLLLSLSTFGQELSWGTFSVLLSQPVSRRRLWLVKVVVVAVALGFAFLALCVSNHIRVESTLESMKHTVWRNAFERPGEQSQFFAKLIGDTRRAASQDTFLIGGLEVLAGFAGGLWTTLLFRQVTAAFWLTFLVPMGLAVLASSILNNFSDAISRAGLALILGAYSTVGFLWAKRFFLRVQDTQWTGGVIALAGWGELTAGLGPITARRRPKPIRALLRKEFQAQQVNVLLAGGLLLVHLGVLAVRRWGIEYLAAHQSMAMTLEMIPLLWLAMPLLVGSVAVAEERKLGMFQSTLCLPASRRVQFLTKLAVALVLGFLFGGVLPVLIEQLAPRGSIGGAFNGLIFLGEIRPIIFIQLSGAVGLTLLAFYGSTLTRNALQGMGAGLLGAIITCLVILGAIHAGDYEGLIPWRGRLIAWIGWPVMVPTMFVLAYRNYAKLQPDLRTWFRNAVTLFAALLCVAAATTTLYHRAWEAWLPEEPPHRYTAINVTFMNWFGKPIPRPTRKSPKLEAAAFQKAVVLPDGRLWLQQRRVRRIDQTSMNQGMVAWYATGPGHSGFVAGSNWKDVAITQSGCFGIQADGTLWNVSESEEGGTTPKRVGQAHDWAQISAGGERFCALKSDGTLWQWGWKYSSAGPKQMAPTQVGTDNDWVAACESWTTTAAVKSDGSIWRWDWESRTHNHPKKWLIGACSETVSLALNDRAVASVCDDGTLWIGGSLTNSVYAHLIELGEAQRAAVEMVRWGNDSDWKEIQFVSWASAVGIKRDGTLWEWDLHRAFGPLTGWVFPPTTPSRYTDWMSVCRDDNGFLALARDGSLCLWGDTENGTYFDWNGPDPRRLMMPSRIKARNIADLAK